MNQTVTLGSRRKVCSDNLPADDVKMPHPAGASGLPPLGLHGPEISLLASDQISDTFLNSPSETPDLGGGEAAGSTLLLLDMERNLTTPPAQSVRLVAPHSKG